MQIECLRGLLYRRTVLIFIQIALHNVRITHTFIIILQTKRTLLACTIRVECDFQNVTFILLLLLGSSDRGEGGGVLRFGADGGVPLHEAAKPVPIFKGHFWRKRVPIIRGFYSRK